MKSIFVLFILVSTVQIHAQINHADSLSISNQSDQEEDIFTIVEVMPKFPGGDNALSVFLAKNIIYPAMEREMGVQGKVIASFVIEEDGSITNIKIEKGIGEGCDHEVLRVLRKMPKWEPGMNKSKAVKVKYQLPVNFIIK